MHAVFMLYGIEDAVNFLKRDMQAQKFLWELKDKKGKVKKKVWVQGSLRLMPFGFYEYIFPKEYADEVLTTLGFNEPIPYENNYGTLYKWGIKKVKAMLKIREAPKIKDKGKIPWITQGVSIIPLGVKYDEDRYFEEDGFNHEAL